MTRCGSGVATAIAVLGIITTGCDRTPPSYLKTVATPKLEPGWTKVQRKGIDYTFDVPLGWVPLKVDADQLDDANLFPSEPAGFDTLMSRIAQKRQALAALNGDLLNIGFGVVISEDAGHNLTLKREADDMEKDIRSIEAFELVGREEMDLPIGRAARVEARMREASTQYHMVITGYVLVDGHTRYTALFAGLTGGADGSLPTRRIMATLRVHAKPQEASQPDRTTKSL